VTLQRRQKIELTIDSLAHGGAGVGRVDGMAVFVRGAAPGDRHRARVTKRKSRHAEARIEEIIEPGPQRREPPCPLVGRCGGCTWQHLPYPAQAEAKQQIVAETLQHIAGITDLPIEPITHAPDEFRYRNKMDFTFGRSAEGEVTLGLHRVERFDEIVDISKCLLQPEPFDALLDAFRAYARRAGLTPYSPHSHRGLLRSVILREGRNTGEVIAVLITAQGELPNREGLVRELRAACPTLKGFVWGINAGKADVARIDSVAWAWGDANILEQLGDQRYAISPTSFFQTNTRAAEVLLRLVENALDLTGDEILLDAFCGTGVIGLHCAPRCRHVFGVELHLPAVQMARRNAEINGLENCTFLSGDARQTLQLVRHVAESRINRVLVDPPRGGMHRKALQQLIALQAPVFVYVSCNPTTLARDLQDLRDAGYVAERLWPLDMFPQTYHIEAVVRLVRPG
jgi:23S rRNA (uracil1939-C5)-methyltransferase